MANHFIMPSVQCRTASSMYFIENSSHTGYLTLGSLIYIKFSTLPMSSPYMQDTCRHMKV